MRFYLFTTAKFVDQCIEHGIYGSTNSNWLANVDTGDIIFISQFNFLEQKIYGPFKVIKNLFYDKKLIYPGQRYYFRVGINPLFNTVRKIEETDIFLKGIQENNLSFASDFICLIQQNKHLHTIPLTNAEGDYLLQIFNNYSQDSLTPSGVFAKNSDTLDVNSKLILEKGKVLKNNYFTSESDLEAFVIFELKKEKDFFNTFSKILKKFPNNDLNESEVYNQFIFGNAYPCDITILNEENINILELKKNSLCNISLNMVEKEFRKYCYYSLFSNRIKEKFKKRLNFFLIIAKDKGNQLIFKNVIELFNKVIQPIEKHRVNNLIILEYSFKNNLFILEKLTEISN